MSAPALDHQRRTTIVREVDALTEPLVALRRDLHAHPEIGHNEHRTTTVIVETLERAGLVTSTKQGRVRTYRIARSALELVDGWLAEQRRIWERKLDQLDGLLLTMKEST